MLAEELSRLVVLLHGNTLLDSVTAARADPPLKKLSHEGHPAATHGIQRGDQS
jgi:hypothetical protein